MFVDHVVMESSAIDALDLSAEVAQEEGVTSFESLAENSMKLLYESEGYADATPGSFAVYHDLITGRFMAEQHTGDAFMPAILIEV
jgi:hypothetical protein